MNIVQLLQKLDFDEKDIRLYMLLLSLGPSSVRKLATASGINRGTTYDILKTLMGRGLVCYFHKDKKQCFIVEDPAKLEKHIEGRLYEMNSLREKVRELVPELQSMYNRGGGKPVVRYFEGQKGVKLILDDVLHTMGNEKHKEYYAYSAADVRGEVYKSYPKFTTERIKRGIRVKVIALGSGGEVQELSERKWLTKSDSAPSYTLLYGNKKAHISRDPHGEMCGVVIDDAAITSTQKMVFEKLWEML